MRGGGAGVFRGPSVARAFALLAVATLLGPVLPLVAPPAAAQAGSDPWWGPASRGSPTDGWAVRVPVTVENTFDYRIDDAIVSVDVDFGRLLVEAGWTSQLLGTEARLRGFTLDVDSIRVVEYGRAFAPGPIHGPTTEPTPHTFYASPFYAEKYRDFDPARNPSGTVLFFMKGSLDPGQKRFFYVYANPLEYGKKEPHTWKLEERAMLDAFLWGTTGTRFYGYEPQQANRDHRLVVRALFPDKDTVVTTYEMDFGRFVPSRSTPATPNPLTLGGANPSFGSLFIPGGKAFKIESTRPIVVAGHGDLDDVSMGSTQANAYFPSTTGSFRGSSFWVYGFGAPPGANDRVAIVKASPGTVKVRAGMEERELTNANAFGSITIPGGQWTLVTTTDPKAEILVGRFQLILGNSVQSSAGVAYSGMQVPAITGGPSGTTFYQRVPKDGGYFQVCPEARTGIRVVDGFRPDVQVFPPGPRDTTPPNIFLPSAGCELLRATTTTPDNRLELYAIGPETRYPIQNAPVPFRLVVGAQGRDTEAIERPFVGHYGGLRGTDFHVSGRTGVFAYFDDTRITIFEELRGGGSVNRTFSLSTDGYQAFEAPNKVDASKTGRYRIVASKPISVVSTEEFNAPYARIVPGLPANPTVHVGLAEYRGPLVELRSPDTQSRQLYRSTGPNTPITFRLEAANLGRWIAGENLPDAITISCNGPSEWEIQGCDRELNVASGNSELFEVTITPSADDVNTTSFIDVRAKSATPGIESTFRLAIYVEIRYGVGLWFDVENGRKTIDPIVGVDPGETHDYTVVIKNTGSTRDTFALAVDAPKEGWTQSLTLDGEPVSEVTLNGGETRLLRFAVTAPNQETAPQNLVSITAESRSSDLASAKDLVNTATRIRPNINIQVEVDPPTRVAEPNTTAVFNLTIANRGNDVFRIYPEQTSVLPAGWAARFVMPGEDIDLPPGLNATVPFHMTPPLGARAGDLATAKITIQVDAGGGAARITADEVSAVTVVKRIHNLTTPPLADARADPGQTVRYVLPLTNRGNGDDLVELLPGGATEWVIRALEPTVLLGVNQTADLPLEFDVPAGARPGTHNLSVPLRLSREDTMTIVLPVDVRAVAKAEIRGLSQIDAAPARATTIPLTVANVGNLPAEFVLQADLPAGWNATFRPPTLTLQPGERADATLVLNASRATVDGDHAVSLGAAVGDARVGEKALGVRVARPELYIANVASSGDLAPGELVIVAATVGNRGAIAAEDVRVALVVDGVVVDQVTLQRVVPGESQVATLNWLATRRGADVQVVIDPENQIVMPDTATTRAAVSFGSNLFGVPAPGVLALLAALAVGAALAGRRRRA